MRTTGNTITRLPPHHQSMWPNGLALSDVTTDLDSILTANALAIRIRVGDVSVLVGDKRTPPQAELVFSSRRVVEKVLQRTSLYSLARAYLDGTMGVVGSMQSAIDVMYAVNVAHDRARTPIEALKGQMFRLGKGLLPRMAKRFESNAHYSMSPGAYRLFLDKNMQYTCGKFVNGHDTIDQAQINKFELIARVAENRFGKLRGVRHLDLGSGWGGLVCFMRDTYGMESVGCTNNRTQFDYAREAFGADVIFGDFSELPTLVKPFDLVTIVGMAEHLTPRRRDLLFGQVRRKLVRDGGLIYFQCIAKPDVWIGGDAYRIAYRDVFPGHYLETQAEMEERFKRLNLRICYSSDDPMDYAKTTALWAGRLAVNEPSIVGMIGEANFRMFYGYLSYASKLFSEGRGSLMRYMLSA